ncbi:hypothetical protein NC796_22715, partial [Aliifodinibius sp. S!AR15-10]|uniref:hypothetical protein n=1 Tax=Aliifodinibius sp. S!AR15-10 TaxID=2950437 RepID=UPI00285C3C56
TELMALIRHKKIPFELKIGDVRLNLSVLGKIPKTRGSAKAPKTNNCHHQEALVMAYYLVCKIS